MTEVARPKKMNLMQLTFIVAVNMMGSGIIMLPTNMAKVGAISLLSWIVTALGSMAIAFGFAQAGLFNQRPGGMAAYAEDAYGKSGYFLVFFLYFLSLAIGNVAIAISAVGYLASFFPWLSSSPGATCLGVIGLLWLTTGANFGGPKWTGRIGSVTVWGVIIPVGFLSLFGWFWFRPETFSAAWNPNSLSLAQGMGSSISLTLWAFLGMESAAQNSNAVENPKRDVPLACMLGTLGAAVIYVLSTMVIQGIVSNPDLAKSTGPFGLAYAHMFNPTIGSVIMALAIVACIGSLLGWQFTIAQTGKSAADDRMFPTFFSKVNSFGAPIIGMIVLGFVQSGLALSTISPTLSEQFSALVNLAVVTNVIPYIISLSALMVMMQAADIAMSKFRLTAGVAVVAILYSIYAIYASGYQAVMGGMLVTTFAYLIWGFLAPRFSMKSSPHQARLEGSMSMANVGREMSVVHFEQAKLSSHRGKRAGLFAIACATALVLASTLVTSASADDFDKIRQTGKIVFGYRTDARPFSFNNSSGKADGYSVALCEKIAGQVKQDLQLSNITIEWVPVTAENQIETVKDGKVNLFCGGAIETITLRRDVDFSIPIFPGGIGVLLRIDAPIGLKETLSGRQSVSPLWRGNPAQVVTGKSFAAVENSPSQSWLAGRLNYFQLAAKIVPVDGYETGLNSVLNRNADAFFAERSILLDFKRNNSAGTDVVVLDRQFTHSNIALVLGRGNGDFRLAIDKALSHLYGKDEFKELYVKWFGELSDSATAFFRDNALLD